jgi:hypothetical protein
LCTIDPRHGNALVHLGEINASVSDATNVTWYYNYTITEGESALVDGAKRDKLVWAGGELTFTGGFGCVANSGGRYGYCGAGDCGLDKRCHLDRELVEFAVCGAECKYGTVAVCGEALFLDT